MGGPSLPPVYLVFIGFTTQTFVTGTNAVSNGFLFKCQPELVTGA